jgi:hypothetical protein
MGKFAFIARAFLGIVALVTAPSNLAIAHEAHKAECTETAINAASADIQAMPDGEAKTKAAQEMRMAEEMMAKKDMEACVTHLHKAMEAAEE